MSPAIKYTLGRLGLFVVVFAALFPLPLNILVKAMIAFVASAGFSFILLRKWRNEMAEHLGSVVERRTAEKQRLRSALAGDDDAVAAGDRVAAADASTPAPTEEKTAPTEVKTTQAEKTAPAEVKTVPAGEKTALAEEKTATAAGSTDTDVAAATGELKSETKSDAGK
ncbi:DUF4229 domain-containing protein [Actinoplanes palleronii]|uniref:DUF4229 domain-containing protein n=1 Tax=Actinoplanes palleronii TaxID=113570 RepID=A0ABQ4BAG8_9ACTN|nr:hypothetical protein Apa02nite_037510 [Actinoplanes palleronii]